MTWALIVVMMGLLMPTGSKPSDQGEMLSLLKRHEIQVLLRAGFTVADECGRSQREIASSLSLRSARLRAPEAGTCGGADVGAGPESDGQRGRGAVVPRC